MDSAWQALLQGSLWVGVHVARRQHATISDQSGPLDMSNDRSRIVPIAQDRQPLSLVFYRALAYTALAAQPAYCRKCQIQKVQVTHQKS